MGTCPFIHIFGQMGNVDIAEFHLICIDGFPQILIGLMAVTAFQEAGPGPGSIDAVSHRGSYD